MAAPGARISPILPLLLVLAPATAAAEPMEVGAMFGPRFFSEDAAIGAKDTYRTTLQNSFSFGPRLAMPLLPWLVPEVELALAPTDTEDLDVAVLWLEPRAHLRFLWPRGQVRPFALLGGGMPTTLSDKRGIFGSDISYEGYGGFGALFSPGRGLAFRLDLRVGVTDGFEAPIAVEVEATAGLYIELPWQRKRRGAVEREPGPPGDSDNDHIADDRDRCPDRPEDEDGFEDKDGCPDIDNDLDRVLDIADKCPALAETFNGFEDDDGCVDSIPGPLAGVLGTIEGLLYGAGKTAVLDDARPSLEAIADVLEKYPSVRIVVVGHSDNQEDELEADPDEDPEAFATRRADARVELSRERALEVKRALVAGGVAATRVDVVGMGDAEPVSENDRPRGRLRNRRVELRLYVPER